jgi:tetratricopeptide (TPR) repeat protein
MSSPFTAPEADQIIAAPSALEVLWMNHRGALLGTLAALVVAALVVLGILGSNRANRIASENLLASATDDAGWNAVISGYPRTPAAADAMLLLAASLRNQGKLEDSDALYSRFAETFPQNQLAVSSLLGRASNARFAGKPEAAFSAYQQAASAFAGSYGAPFALFCQARMLTQDGRGEDARKIIELLGSQYAASVSASAAGLNRRQGAN